MDNLLLTIFVYGCFSLLSTSATKCERNYVKCRDGIQCVFHGFLCDGFNNCEDQSDEDEDFCKANICQDNYVKCKDNLQCVRAIALCDGYHGCRDNSDEDQDFCRATKCKEPYEKCKDGLQCVHYAFKCDGDYDCRDKSDEDEDACQGENEVTTADYLCICINDNYVKCKDGLQCVYRGFLCDGDVKSDCRDKSDEDEYFCKANKCKTFHISCNDDLSCVSVTSMCDGQDDCKDKTDENPDFCKDFLPLIK